MPNFFQLFKKGESDPADLHEVDEAICALLAEPVDSDYYCIGWFDCIGWEIAVNGHQLGSFELCEKVTRFTQGNSEWQTLMLRVLEWLDANYTSASWVRIRK